MYNLTKKTCKHHELRLARAMIFAIEEINNSTELLPGIKLGYKIYDSCASVSVATHVAFQLSNGEDPVIQTGHNCSNLGVVMGVIGASSSTPSIGISRIFGPFNIPLVSHFATCACLSDKQQFPTFFRTIPSDHYQADVLAKLVKHFGWTWIGTVFINHFKTLLRQLKTDFIQVNLKVVIYVFFLFRSTSIVVVAFTATGDMKLLFEELNQQPSPPRQWIGSEGWITDLQLMRFSFCAGAIGVAIQQSVIPGFGDFLLGLLICVLFKESYLAVYAIAHAIHTAVCQETSSTSNCKKRSMLDLSQVFTKLKEVNFTQNGYHVSFDANGDPVAFYEVVNWQKSESGIIEPITVGYYDASLPKGQEFCINRNLTWLDGVSVCSESCPPGTRKVLQKGKPICCYDCVPCPEGEISNMTDSPDCAACPREFWPNAEKDACFPKAVEFLSFDEILSVILAVFSISGACLAIITTVIFFHHRTTPIVRANNSELSFLLLFSLTLCFLCSLTFIGAPSEWSCMLRHTAFGITFVLCISCVLGKTIVVLMAFKATLPGSNAMKWFGPLQQRLTEVALTFIQVIICIIWLVVSPPVPVKNLSTYKEKIILECALGSAVGFWAVLGYIGLLAVFCFVLAVLARKLPDNFNEAKMITFSMLIFCAVWITFIPAYVSSPGKFTVAVEIFAILASSFGLILCIFAPKCFIILFQPEKNTKKYLMNKN
uniref:G-protein coupled receptors family 3 profile domain-containing protein n=1 Tax=Poecilia latipinna TaxID=48699 RepID=A0A3B3V370_9TELE